MRLFGKPAKEQRESRQVPAMGVRESYWAAYDLVEALVQRVTGCEVGSTDKDYPDPESYWVIIDGVKWSTDRNGLAIYRDGALVWREVRNVRDVLYGHGLPRLADAIKVEIEHPFSETADALLRQSLAELGGRP